jgi:hypothetical protein
MTTSILLNGLSAVSARLVIPYKGVWSADVDFDLEVVPVPPFGPAILTIGKTVFLGFIDPDGSGKFGAKGRARVLGGFGGWHKELPAQHFTNDAGVLSTAVLLATGALVGEKVAQAIPSFLGQHYTRAAGPASRVLTDLDWYVDTITGVTIVGPRLPIPVRPDTVEILDWDPLEQRATVATDEVLQPGSVLIDIRFGTAQVRDVEQVFDAGGSRATAHCRKTGLDIAGMLASVARETITPEYQQRHTYRVVLQSPDGRLALQAVELLGPVPDMLPIALCLGVPGFDSKLTPGSEVHVEFADGDPSKPRVTGFSAGNPPPLEVSCNAIHIANGLGTSPVGLSVGLQAQITALTAAVGVLAGYVAVVTNAALVIPAFPAYAAALVAPGNAVAASLGGLSAAIAAQVPLATSTRTFSD